MFAVDVTGKDHIARLPLERAEAALKERADWLETVLREAGPELDAKAVRSVPVEMSDGADLSGLVLRVTEELDALTDRVQALRKQDQVLAKAREAAARLLPQQAEAERPAYKSLADVARKSGLMQALRELRPASAVVEDADPAVLILGKAALTTGGYPPEVPRLPQVALTPTPAPAIYDVVPLYQTGANAVAYLEETTYTNAAAERAEGAAYAESSLGYTERSVPVRSLGHHLPVSDELREDVVGIDSFINVRLLKMVRDRLNSQIVNGNGTLPNILGTLNVSGIQTQARGTDPHADAVLKAMTKVRTNGAANPSVVLLNPKDWETIRLTKTTDGVYLFGPPYDAGIPRIWGVPVVTDNAVPLGTGIVGDYAAHAGLFLRTGVEVQVALNADDFTRGRMTFRAGMRCALVHFRPAAFCTVTGL